MIPATVRVFVYNEPVDMRRGFDTLAAIGREKLQQDVQSGALLIFTNRRRNRLKALWWDRNGHCILYKRLHQAVFELPNPQSQGEVSVRIDGQKLVALLAGIPKKKRPNLQVVR